MPEDRAVTLPMVDLRVELPDGFVIDTGTGRLNLEQVHEWLSTDSYWAIDRSMEAVERAAAASINFGLYGANGAQVGYARVVTDGVTFGWLCDVYIAREVRGRGLGTALAKAIKEAVRPFGLKKLLLGTRDAHGVYAKAGFVAFPDPEKLMVIEGSQRR